MSGCVSSYIILYIKNQKYDKNKQNNLNNKNAIYCPKYAAFEYYIGNFKNDQRDGIGKQLFQNIYCEGEFLNDRVNGYGIYKNEKGTIFEGTFINSIQQEIGISINSDSSKYEGEYKDGKFNGQGTYTYADGDQYTGEFKDGKINGAIKGKNSHIYIVAFTNFT